MKNRKLTFLIILGFVLFLSVVWQLNKRKSPTQSFDKAKEKELALTGEELAKVHCAACHPFPEPSLLDKKTWVNSVLPPMGSYFGIKEHHGMYGHRLVLREPELNQLPETRAQIRMMDEQIIPSEDWEQILCYYHYHAPEDIMEGVSMPKIKGTLQYFKARSMKHPAMKGMRPQTTCVKILPSSASIAFASYRSPDLRFANKEMKLTRVVRDLPGITDIEQISDGTLIFNSIGTLKPTEKKQGKLIKHQKNSVELATGLHRPVSSKPFNANGDQLSDFLICEYGHYTGRLSWLETLPNQSHKKHLILEKANPVAAHPCDADGDGDTDIYALFAGGSEGIWLFSNDGKGSFTGKELVTFAPTMGSNALKVVDIDLDGDLDLLHVAGDNDDTSKTLKPYHGLRIYLNDGQQNFALSQHYPMHGAYQAEATDFDLDGDIDIALCSQFPDYHNHPEQSFIILMNEGELNFTARSHVATHGYRWTVMDAADIDADGDTDIVLGSMLVDDNTWLNPGPSTLHKWNNAPEILFLENTTK